MVMNRALFVVGLLLLAVFAVLWPPVGLLYAGMACWALALVRGANQKVGGGRR